MTLNYLIVVFKDQNINPISYFCYIVKNKVIRRKECLKNLNMTKRLNCGIEYLIGKVVPNFRGKCCEKSSKNLCYITVLAFTVEYFIKNVCSSYECLTKNFELNGFGHGVIFE